jgi:dephospho-CoA kinase
MAARVFTEPALKKKLEAILHPLVRGAMKSLSTGTKQGIVVLDIPLLFESGLTGMVDRVCVVWAPAAVRYARLMKSKRFSRGDIRNRFKAQMPLKEKRRRADDVIDNGGSLASTRSQARRLWRAWKSGLSSAQR